jgi:hypothetical protein
MISRLELAVVLTGCVHVAGTALLLNALEPRHQQHMRMLSASRHPRWIELTLQQYSGGLGISLTKEGARSTAGQQRGSALLLAQPAAGGLELFSQEQH